MTVSTLTRPTKMAGALNNGAVGSNGDMSPYTWRQGRRNDRSLRLLSKVEIGSDEGSELSNAGIQNSSQAGRRDTNSLSAPESSHTHPTSELETPGQPSLGDSSGINSEPLNTGSEVPRDRRVPVEGNEEQEEGTSLYQDERGPNFSTVRLRAANFTEREEQSYRLHDEFQTELGTDIKHASDDAVRHIAKVESEDVSNSNGLETKYPKNGDSNGANVELMSTSVPDLDQTLSELSSLLAEIREDHVQEADSDSLPVVPPSTKFAATNRKQSGEQFYRSSTHEEHLAPANLEIAGDRKASELLEDIHDDFNINDGATLDSGEDASYLDDEPTVPLGLWNFDRMSPAYNMFRSRSEVLSAIASYDSDESSRSGWRELGIELGIAYSQLRKALENLAAQWELWEDHGRTTTGEDWTSDLEPGGETPPEQAELELKGLSDRSSPVSQKGGGDPTWEEFAELGWTEPLFPERETSPKDAELTLEALNPGQRKVFDMALEGHNLFITGPAGTGKSFVLMQIIEAIQRRFPPSAVGVCASTGIAAEALGGCTLHALLGLGTSVDRKKLVDCVRSKEIKKLRVLIIDEVSMVSGELLDLIDDVLREVKRRKQQPFGGVQMIFCGDFYQLAPVQSRKYLAGLLEEYPETDPDTLFLNYGYAFQSRSWLEGNICIMSLNRVHRQGDPTFQRALEDIRIGKVSRYTMKLAEETSRALEVDANGIDATHLFSRNADVDKLNRERLEKIEEESHLFEAIDMVEVSSSLTAQKLEAQEKLREYELKKKSKKKEEEVQQWRKKLDKLAEEATKAEDFLRTQSFFRQCRAPKELELKVGAQVQLLQNVRNRDLTLRLSNGSQGIVRDFDDDGDPIVEFRNGTSSSIEPAKFKMEIPGVGSCVRFQIPLALSWAITIHKSQGQTIEYVRVDAGRVFAFGQIYVALSRAKAIEGLEVASWDPFKQVFRNYAVEEFYMDVHEQEYSRTETWQNIRQRDLEAIAEKIEARRKRLEKG